jgi:hypothetical protein
LVLCHKHELLQHEGLVFPGLGLGGRLSCPRPPSQTAPIRAMEEKVNGREKEEMNFDSEKIRGWCFEWWISVSRLLTVGSNHDVASLKY